MLDPAVLAARCGRRFLRRARRPALLMGWRRVMLRREPFPTLRRARGGQVQGVIIRLCGGPLRRLMAYEGAAYRLRPVRPPAGGTRTCRCNGLDHLPLAGALLIVHPVRNRCDFVDVDQLWLNARRVERWHDAGVRTVQDHTANGGGNVGSRQEGLGH
ncbi:gamma-glutamylcyclotransferase family protein [Falsiroseomonas sp. E2-1-a4]|uniref:gamma-glutamylcyclotransferase family protein n=1 Tax=Falsiroseomonas sp. E2-1-a4 TaxID=3239299 RepID=UPI003F3E0FB0